MFANFVSGLKQFFVDFITLKCCLYSRKVGVGKNLFVNLGFKASPGESSALTPKCNCCGKLVSKYGVL